MTPFVLERGVSDSRRSDDRFNGFRLDRYAFLGRLLCLNDPAPLVRNHFFCRSPNRRRHLNVLQWAVLLTQGPVIVSATPRLKPLFGPRPSRCFSNGSTRFLRITQQKRDVCIKQSFQEVYTECDSVDTKASSVIPEPKRARAASAFCGLFPSEIACDFERLLDRCGPMRSSADPPGEVFQVFFLLTRRGIAG